ncbi:hypothetical protein [Veronia pacifica]|uniref:Uncharacterized protein n=1 Tax=Veronia pacifica TaxID=1080227 RepID=A0A1C3E9I3_9GAMM|nr:hypothetical protein [Veronia pacifica]ODA29890.1 hypothetical protein A8L45_21250 [Veronia pacifica]
MGNLFIGTGGFFLFYSILATVTVMNKIAYFLPIELFSAGSSGAVYKVVTAEGPNKAEIAVYGANVLLIIIGIVMNYLAKKS